jgi:hypothetical protein
MEGTQWKTQFQISNQKQKFKSNLTKYCPPFVDNSKSLSYNDRLIFQYTHLLQHKSSLPPATDTTQNAAWVGFSGIGALKII